MALACVAAQSPPQIKVKYNLDNSPITELGRRVSTKSLEASLTAWLTVPQSSSDLGLGSGGWT